MKNACRSTAAILSVILAATLVLGAGIGDDPQSLLRKAEEQLADGDISSSRESVGRLKSLIESDPYWDPDGSFMQVLIPSLDERISRIKDAENKLEELNRSIRSDLVPVEHGDDPADLRSALVWAERLNDSVNSKLREVTSGVPDAIDRCALMQSKTFAMADSLIDSTVIPRMADTVIRGTEALADEDQRYLILKRRLDEVKRDLITSSVSNDDLERRLADTSKNISLCRRTLFGLAGALPQDLETYAQPEGVGDAFAALVRNRLASIRTTHSQNPVEKAVRLEEVRRFRILNEADLGVDTKKISSRIDALEEEIEDLRVVCDQSDQSAGWLACCTTLRESE